MQHRKWMLFIAVIFMVCFIAACGSASEENENTNNNNDGNNAAEEIDPVIDYTDEEAEITVFSVLAHTTFDELIRTKLDEKFPKFKITHIASNDGFTVEELVVGGTNVDLYIGRAGSILDTYIPLELATDMTELIERHGVNTDDFAEAYIDNVSIDGNLYALPLYDEILVLYYNKELFDRFGVDPPVDGMTWDEALEIADDMTRYVDGRQYIGLWMSPRHYFRMNQLSLDFVNPETHEADILTDEWKLIFDKLFYETTRSPGIQEIAQQRIAAAAQSNGEVNRQGWLGHGNFTSEQNVAMYAFMTNWLSTSHNSLPLDWDVVSLPTFSDYPGRGTQPYGDFIGVTSISENPDAAMQVVKYLTGEEYQTFLSSKGKITPLKSQAVRDAAFSEHPEFGEKNFGAVYVNEPAPIRNITPYDELVLDTAFTEGIIPDIAAGNLDVNAALQRAKDIADMAIEQAKVRGE